MKTGKEIQPIKDILEADLTKLTDKQLDKNLDSVRKQLDIAYDKVEKHMNTNGSPILKNAMITKGIERLQAMEAGYANERMRRLDLEGK